MFFKDKYKPKFFKDYFIYKNEISKLKNLTEKGDIPNILFYGQDRNENYTMARCFLNESFNKEIEIEQKLIKLRVNNYLKEIELYASQYHFEIDIMKYNSLLNRTNLINIIKMLVSYKEINGECNYKIILIKNIHNINHSLAYIKNFIEKYSDNVRFIFTSSKLSNNLIEILSFFLFFKLPTPSNNEYLDLCKHIVSIEGKGKITHKSISYIIETNDRLENILLKLEIALNNKTNYIDPIDNNITQLFNLVVSKKINNISKIRELIYKLISNNLDIKIIFKNIFKKFINYNEISDAKKIQIICLFCKYEPRIYKSYKDLIHLEALLISILNNI